MVCTESSAGLNPFLTINGHSTGNSRRVGRYKFALLIKNDVLGSSQNSFNHNSISTNWEANIKILFLGPT